jgi:hypothetical protein
MRLDRPLVWALALAALALSALVIARAFAAPQAGALVAAATAPGIFVAAYEIARALDRPVDDAARRSAWAAIFLLAVPFVVLLTFARLLGVVAPWHLSR